MNCSFCVLHTCCRRLGAWTIHFYSQFELYFCGHSFLATVSRLREDCVGHCTFNVHITVGIIDGPTYCIREKSSTHWIQAECAAFKLGQSSTILFGPLPAATGKRFNVSRLSRPPVRCRDVSRGTCSQFEQPASCGWGTEWHGSGAKLAVETEIFMYFLRVGHFGQDPHTSTIQAIPHALYLTPPYQLSVVGRMQVVRPCRTEKCDLLDNKWIQLIQTI